jgi:hypothetical protein
MSTGIMTYKLYNFENFQALNGMKLSWSLDLQTWIGHNVLQKESYIYIYIYD